MRIEQISFPHHGRTVDATAYWPDRNGAVPCVILSHGYNGHKDDSARQAVALAEQGFAAVCITFCGGSTRDVSGFPSTGMTLWT